MKSLYTDKLCYTADGSAVEDEAHAALRPLMQKWVAAGYSPREVSHVLISAATILECESVLDMRSKEGVKP